MDGTVILPIWIWLVKGSHAEPTSDIDGSEGQEFVLGELSSLWIFVVPVVMLEGHEAANVVVEFGPLGKGPATVIFIIMVCHLDMDLVC